MSALTDSLARIRAIIAKELRQVFRDPRMRVVLFVVPIVQLLVFTYAATTDVRHVATAVLDRDHSATSRELVARLVRSTYFDVVAWPADGREALALMDAGRVRIVLELPAGLAADAAAGRTPAVMLAADGTDANAAALVSGYAARITAAYVAERAASQAARAGQAVGPPPYVLAARAWYNPNLESKDFYVPGILVMLVTVITLNLTAMAIVREREIGTIEQLLVTPIRPIELILGKTAPFALIGLVDATLVLIVATGWFEVPLRGGLGLFYAAIGAYLLATLAGGLFISTVSRTQQQAMMGAFFFAFPAILLSGFMFPLQNMPWAIQLVTYLNPLRYVIEMMRGLFLKGLGPADMAAPLAALAAIGVLAFAGAVWRFQKT